MLLVAAICCLEQEETPQNAYQWRLLLQQAGIIPDNVSSMLRAYGLRLKTETGFHPAYDIFCDRKEPYVITMENLYRVRAAQPIGKQVYVVENEMVFTYLLHHVKRDSYTLLCTSGQLRAAAQKADRITDRAWSCDLLQWRPGPGWDWNCRPALAEVWKQYLPVEDVAGGLQEGWLR